MAEILIAGLSAAGHVTPLLAIAGGLAMTIFESYLTDDGRKALEGNK